MQGVAGLIDFPLQGVVDHAWGTLLVKLVGKPLSNKEYIEVKLHQLSLVIHNK